MTSNAKISFVSALHQKLIKLLETMALHNRVRAVSVAITDATTSKLSRASSSYASVLPLQEESEKPSFVVREAGACRSVFVLNPNFNLEELKGFVSQLRAWRRNESMNSVFITCPDDDIVCQDGRILPLSAQYKMSASVAKSTYLIRPNPYLEEDDHQRHVLLGFDPLATDEIFYNDILDKIGEISEAMTDPSRKTPIITCPDGLVSDGGLVFLLGQYVLATPQTSFRIDSPTRGLSLDPCGMSYILSRVGCDFEQEDAQKYASTIAKILALTGYEADGYDMVATGLATHFVESKHNIPLTETNLSEILPYKDQGLLPKLPRSQAQWIKDKKAYLETGDYPEDISNRRFRNVAVHNLIETVSSGQAGRDDFFAGQQPITTASDDPFQENTDLSLGFDGGSLLIDFAATFHHVFNKNSVHDIMEELRDISNNKDEDEDIVKVSSLFLKGMEERSPVSLKAVHKLLDMANDSNATLTDCIAREKVVQKNLLEKEDFKNWFELTRADSTDLESVPSWKHKSVADISDDEIEELFYSN